MTKGSLLKLYHVLPRLPGTFASYMYYEMVQIKVGIILVAFSRCVTECFEA